jgi:hypothetical protein
MRHHLPSRVLLALATSLGLAIPAGPAHSSVGDDPSAPAAASASGLLTATLAGDTLMISWTPQNGDRVAVFDEHLAKFIYQGSGLATTLDVPADSGASLTVYRLGADGEEALGRVQAMRPPADSSLAEVVSVTSADATAVGLGTSQARERWQIDAGDHTTQVADLSDTTVPLGLGSTKQVVLTSSTIEEDVPTFLTQGVRLSAPVSYSQAEATDGGAVPANVVTNTLTQMFYDTFIPDKWVDAPDSDFIPYDCDAGDGSNYVYAGDDIVDEFNHPTAFRTRGKTPGTGACVPRGPLRR